MTNRNALANSVRALPAIAGLNQIWQKREDESDQDYWFFLDWLDRGAKRGAPPAKHMVIAERYEWASRALAYERESEMALSLSGGQTPEQVIVDALTQMVLIESTKLLEQAKKSPESVVGVKDIVATVGALTNLQKENHKAQSSKTDLSKLSTDEIKKVLEAQALLRKAGGK